MVPADPPKVERIVEDVIANALKHTPEGTPIWVMASREDGGAMITMEEWGSGRVAGTGLFLSSRSRVAVERASRGFAWVHGRPPSFYCPPD